MHAGANLQRAALMGLPQCAGELATVSIGRLEAVCREQDAKWLHRLSLGIDDEEVRSALAPAALPLTLPLWPAGPAMTLAYQQGPESITAHALSVLKPASTQ